MNLCRRAGLTVWLSFRLRQVVRDNLHHQAWLIPPLEPSAPPPDPLAAEPGLCPGQVLTGACPDNRPVYCPFTPTACSNTLLFQTLCFLTLQPYKNLACHSPLWFALQEPPASPSQNQGNPPSWNRPIINGHLAKPRTVFQGHPPSNRHTALQFRPGHCSHDPLPGPYLRRIVYSGFRECGL